MTDTLHERCLRAAEEALPPWILHRVRAKVATAMEKLVGEERDRALEEAANHVKQELLTVRLPADLEQNRPVPEVFRGHVVGSILALKGAGR
jgi:hypothetical protein